MANSITHWDGTAWRYSNFYRETRQDSAVIVCPGPSLAKIDTTKLKGAGKTTVGVNTSYPHFIPDMWVGMDDPRCYERDLFLQPFPKFLRGPLYEKNFQEYITKELPNIHYVNVKKGQMQFFWDKVERETPNFIWHNNTFTVVFSILVHMGFKNIYIAGCDLFNGAQDYFHGETLEGVYKDRNTVLYSKLYTWLEWFTPEAKKRGINLHSISPDSMINNLMPYVTVDEMNEKVSEVLPRKAKLWNAFLLQQVKNKPLEGINE